MKKSVFLVKSEQIPSIFKKLFSNVDGKKFFLSFTFLSERHFSLLRHNGFCYFQGSIYSEQEKESFLKEYVDLIAGISKANDSILWWATDLSSKSRFASLVPDQINQLLQIVDTISRQEVQHLLVIGANDSIVCSLKKAFKQEEVEIHAPGYQWRYFIMRCYSECHRLGSIFRHAIRMCLRIFCVRRILRKKIRTWERSFSGKPHYVIKSFVYNHSFHEQSDYRDIFFGDLPSIAKEKTSVFVWANILGDLEYCLKQIQKCKNMMIIPIEWGMTYRQVFVDSLKILFFRIRIPKSQVFRSLDVYDILEYERLKTHDKIQPYQLFHYKALKKILDTVVIHTFVLSFENYPWERQCLLCLRRYSPETHCIGYQHTIVPQSALGMFPGQDEQDILPKPDRILTVGESTRDILKRYGNWGDLGIEPVGAIRFEYLFKFRSLPRWKNKCILLALEGNFDIYKMVNYVIGQCGRTNYQFIIRTHPILPVKMIKHKFIFDLAQYKNIEISQGYSLKEDIERSAITVYWGSSVGVEALWLGRPVIHYDEGSIFSYDPLFECEDLHWCVTDNRRLSDVMDDIMALSDSDFEKKHQRALKYLKRYFKMVTGETWNQFFINSSEGSM